MYVAWPKCHQKPSFGAVSGIPGVRMPAALPTRHELQQQLLAAHERVLHAESNHDLLAAREALEQEDQILDQLCQLRETV